MARNVYRVDILSESSIQNLINQLEEYKKSLINKCEILASRIAELGVEVAKASIVDLDAVFTGELYDSIYSSKISNDGNKVIFAVVADSDHAIYVELGTGIVGAESPYPGNLPVVYAQGKTIRQLSDGRYGWFYQRDGQWYFTEGMPSRPFMYFATMEMYNQVVQIAKEVFG